ncbi:MAG TPA: signal peptidase I [Ktedonobacterales bacterium]
MTNVADSQSNSQPDTAPTGTPPPLHERSQPTASARQQALLREVTTTLLVTVVLFLGLRYSAQAVPLDGPSMQPGLHSTERVLVNSLAYLFRQPQRGDVIVFHPPDALTQRYIKRVIGVPGDVVRLTLNAVYVNNVELDEPYIAPIPPGYSENPEPEVIGLGSDQYFVMGDNRTNSQDSRIFGPISGREIIGKAEFVVWPLGDIHDIDSFPRSFASIPPPSAPR